MGVGVISNKDLATFRALRERMSTQAEIAREYGVGVSTVSNWMTRSPEFPRPIITVGLVKLFDTDAVRAWVDPHIARQAEREAEREAGVKTIRGVKYVRADMVQA